MRKQEILEDIKLLNTDNEPLKVVGSFKDSINYISDIDVVRLTNINMSFVSRLKKMLIKNRRIGTFKFIIMACGKNEEFFPPWKITNEYCDVDSSQYMLFLDRIRLLVSPSDFEKISFFLTLPKITIRVLLEIDHILNTYKKKRWTYEDIMSMDERVFLDLLQKEEQNPVIHFLYKNEIEVDFAITQRVPKDERVFEYRMESFYTEDNYKMLKAIKFGIIPEKKREYWEDIDKIVAKTNQDLARVILIIHLKKYNYNLYRSIRGKTLEDDRILWKERDRLTKKVSNLSKPLLEKYLKLLVERDREAYSSMYEVSKYISSVTDEFFTSRHALIAKNSLISNYKFQECFYKTKNKRIFDNLPGETAFLSEKSFEGNSILSIIGQVGTTDEDLQRVWRLIESQNKKSMQAYLVTGLEI